jgi:hypothetical protein
LDVIFRVALKNLLFSEYDYTSGWHTCGVFHSLGHWKVPLSCWPHPFPSCNGPASRCCWCVGRTAAVSPPALCPWIQFLLWLARWRPCRTPGFRNLGRVPGTFWLCNLWRKSLNKSDSWNITGRQIREKCCSRNPFVQNSSSEGLHIPPPLKKKKKKRNVGRLQKARVPKPSFLPGILFAAHMDFS